RQYPIQFSNSRRAFAFSRRVSPELCFTLHPLEKEGAGKTGRRLAPMMAPVLNIAHAMHRSDTGQPRQPGLPCAVALRLMRALVSAKSARMCERAVLTNRPSLDLSPIVLKGLESLSGSEGQIRCLPQPEQLHGLRARTEQGREWMMAQDDVVVVGID